MRNYFTVGIIRKFVIILSQKIPPHLRCVATLPCEMSSVLKATTGNKTTCVTTHCKKLTTGNMSQLVSEVTATSCSLYIKCSMCPPCGWKTLKPAMPLTNGLINEMLQQFASLRDISATHLRCGGMFSNSIIANFLLILMVKQFLRISKYLISLMHTNILCQFLGPSCT